MKLIYKGFAIKAVGKLWITHFFSEDMHTIMEFPTLGACKAWINNSLTLENMI